MEGGGFVTNTWNFIKKLFTILFLCSIRSMKNIQKNYICKKDEVMKNETKTIMMINILIVLIFYIIPFIYIIITILLVVELVKINEGKFYGDTYIIPETNNIKKIGNYYLNDYVITLLTFNILLIILLIAISFFHNKYLNCKTKNQLNNENKKIQDQIDDLEKKIRQEKTNLNEKSNEPKNPNRIENYETYKNRLNDKINKNNLISKDLKEDGENGEYNDKIKSLYSSKLGVMWLLAVLGFITNVIHIWAFYGFNQKIGEKIDKFKNDVGIYFGDNSLFKKADASNKPFDGSYDMFKLYLADKKDDNKEITRLCIEFAIIANMKNNNYFVYKNTLIQNINKDNILESISIESNKLIDDQFTIDCFTDDAIKAENKDLIRTNFNLAKQQLNNDIYNIRNTSQNVLIAPKIFFTIFLVCICILFISMYATSFVGCFREEWNKEQ
jgi:hypothetical protein